MSLFLKSSTDGQSRTRPINLAIALDVSGSMDSPLKHSIEAVPQQNSRLSLAKKAIMLLFQKLKPEDAFSLVIFHDAARTIIPSAFKKDLNLETVRQLVNSKFQSGGTTISCGFKESFTNMQAIRKTGTMNEYEHRLVLLTDVNDNSVEGEKNLIEQISSAGISCTIIGVSTEFKSETCEKLIKVKGFNYMCAVEESDLQTYLVDQFDYTFFPCVQDVHITLQSQFIEAISVFGSVDHDVTYPVEANTFTVTKLASVFPSALSLNKQGHLQTKGGLILVKFVSKDKKQLPIIKATLKLKYCDLQGKQFEEVYQIDRPIEAQEFYSDEAIKKGVNLFYYTQTMRNLLKDMNNGDNKLSDVNKGFYLDKLNKLETVCPQQKKQELQKIFKIIQSK